MIKGHIQVEVTFRVRYMQGFMSQLKAGTDRTGSPEYTDPERE